MPYPFICLLISLLFFVSCGVQKPADIVEVESTLPKTVDYNRHIKPILSDRCFVCHGPDDAARKAGLRLDQPESAYAELASGDGYAIQPGDVADSQLYHRIISEDADVRMPPPESNLSLNSREKALLIRWIEQGAEYKPHWSFIPLQETKADELVKQPEVDIDYFVEKRLRQEGLALADEADQETLLRRVSFDLTGLPPTLDEINAFLADDSDDAYEKVVDQLLNSPHYGERMALEWLDVGRYADTYGYQADNDRPTWRWRDWVIEAYNQNMPFDEFIACQMAGDLLPNPTTDQIVATGFHRNHPQNAEGGIINEEFRVEYVADRAITTGRAFLGMTFECARCHDHKYDPISQKEFYQFFSFFNNVDEAGQITWSKPDMPSPTMLLFTKEEKKRIAALDEEIKKLEIKIEHHRSKMEENEQFIQWYNSESFHSNNSKLFGRIARFDLEPDTATNKMISSEIDDATGRIVDPVTMKIWDQPPNFISREDGNGIQLDGDAMLDFPGMGRFQKADPFTVAMKVWIPKDLDEGVIFHSNKGGIIYSYKGYQVSVNEDHFDVRFAHTFPYNSIHLISEEPCPREEWIHIALTYDGSGKAAGVHFYVNGELQEMSVKRDNLYKDIVFVHDGITTNLRVGARWRSKGFTNGRLDQIEVYDRVLHFLEVERIAGVNRHSLLADTSESLKQLWAQYYLLNMDEKYKEHLQKLKDLRQKKNDIYENAEEVMVMAEMAEPRQAYLLERGAYNEHGEPVEPGTPKSILAYDDSLPQNRLGLSRWLVDERNPLTARVAVNRMWQQCFGRGLVETSEDFGSQGDLPTHPGLLDWLALKYIQSGWDTKAMMKRIVMSKTYRQSSRITEKLRQRDPENLLLARGPAKRLPAELLRDQALAASGLLTDQIGGPSVKPYQPEGLWSFGSNKTYEQSQGDDLYRRGMYTFWKRTAPHPAMNTFDAPDRSYCIMRREETNTPLQALVLMNDPQFLEAAKMLAVRVMNDELAIDERIEKAFRLLTSRLPNEDEKKALLDYYQNQVEEYESDPDKIEGLLQQGEMDIPRELDKVKTAAMAMVASTIMNSNAGVVLR